MLIWRCFNRGHLSAFELIDSHLAEIRASAPGTALKIWNFSGRNLQNYFVGVEIAGEQR